MSLSLSRSIGDMGFKDERFTGGFPSGLVATPFTATIELAGLEARCLIIASDGFWNSVSHGQAASEALSRLAAGESPRTISRWLLAHAAQARAVDSATVVVVALP